MEKLVARCNCEQVLKLHGRVVIMVLLNATTIRIDNEMQLKSFQQIDKSALLSP